MSIRNELSRLPSVDQLLTSSAGKELAVTYGRQPTVEAMRAGLDRVRQEHLQQETPIPDQDSLLNLVEELLQVRLKPTLVPVINASGVIIHTNLGRAPLSSQALAAVQDVAGGYSSLEFDLESGGRGSRLIHAQAQFKELVGSEAALVVNNNASAVLLCLTVLTRGRKVIISRSQLVEIGGGFRIPDVLKHSGTDLVEVGTTNKVHLFDYEQAYSPDTAAVMRAHTSNYAIVGFTSEPELEEIADSAHQAGLLLLDDLGSGALLDTGQYGLKHEPTVQESLDAGSDLVCFSGDKLLGGPQAGIILGRKDLIDRLKSHPLARAIRADKMALSALTATLDHYLKGEALTEVPVWRMISADLDTIKQRALAWSSLLEGGSVIEARSMVGGGSLPGETLPSWVLALTPSRPNKFLEHLRDLAVPVIARVEDDRVLFDPRTVMPEQDSHLIAALQSLWSET